MEVEGDLLKLELKGTEKILGNYYFNTEEEKMTFIDSYHLGDKLYLTGTLSMPKNNTVPNLFNYKEYLKRKEIYYIMQIDKFEKIEKNSQIFYKIKNWILNHINNYQSKKYLKTFILGDNSLLEDDVINSYQENGISHLLAISGMHISLLSGILLFCLKKLKLSEVICYLIVMIFLFFYMILSGSNPSISRAVVLFCLLYLNRFLNLKISTIQILILTFSVLVIINPYVLFEVGFQYSFIISFYLIMLQKKLNQTSYIKGLMQISIISFIVSFPISIYYFYQINFLSVILNLIFVPLVSFIVFPLSLLTFLFPFLDFLFLWITNIMEQLSILFQTISCFEVPWMKPSIWWIILYYLFLTFYIYYDKKQGVIGLMILCCYQYFYLVLFPRNFFMMIDVGQGDCLLFHSNNQTMLIDTGGKIIYEKEEWQKRNTKSITETTLMPLLKSLGIRSLDYLIISHGDYDHMGEAINLIHNIKIERVVLNGGMFSSQEQELVELLQAKKISYILDNQNNQYQLGNFQLLSLNSEQETENDSSIVFLVKIKQYQFLLMGDCSISVEDQILEEYNLRNIDFLKIGHHGSKTSSSSELLEAINPKFAFISVGLNNRYQHPSQEVMNRLSEYKVSTFLTSIHGTIQINFNKRVTFLINPP